VGVAVVLTCITVSNMDLAVKVQLAALRAESGAKVLALLPPRLAERDNAAGAYREAFEVLQPPGEGPARWTEKVAAWLAADAKVDFADQEVLALLRRHENGMALLRKAAALPGCSFDRDYHQAVDLMLPELQHLREGAALLSLDARSKARQGDRKGAVADVAALFGMARHVSEPILIALMVSVAIDRIAVATLEDVLAQGVKPDEFATLAIADVSYMRELQRDIRMEEAALGLPIYLAVSAGAVGDSLWLREVIAPLGGAYALGTPLYRVFFLQDDLASYRRYMKAYADLAGRPYAEARGDWEELERRIRSDRAGGIVSSLSLPAVQRCVTLATRADAGHRLAQLALAALAFRAKKGAFPARLDELVPAHLGRVPLDPFDGKPLRLKRDGKDLVLYSVGPDGIDDAGNPWSEEHRRGDIVFRLHGR
jgi:hypothetical protein